MGLGLRLSPSLRLCHSVPQQKAKDNRAAHRINKVQKVSGLRVRRGIQVWLCGAASLQVGVRGPTHSSLTVLYLVSSCSRLRARSTSRPRWATWSIRLTDRPYISASPQPGALGSPPPAAAPTDTTLAAPLPPAGLSTSADGFLGRPAGTVPGPGSPSELFLKLPPQCP